MQPLKINITSIILIITSIIFLTAFNRKQTMNSYNEITELSSLKIHIDKKITISGELSEMPWQHLISPMDTHPNIYYFDKNGDQIVIYTKSAINCKKKIKIYGKVIKITGTSKRPGSDQVYAEHQVKVDKWECVDE